MFRLFIVLTAASAIGACATSDGPRASAPSSFIGAPVSAMVEAYGAPSEVSEQAGGVSVAIFHVRDRVASAPVLNRAAYAPRETGSPTGRRQFAGGVSPALRATQGCRITVQYGQDDVVDAVITAPSGCAYISQT